MSPPRGSTNGPLLYVHHYSLSHVVTHFKKIKNLFLKPITCYLARISLVIYSQCAFRISSKYSTCATLSSQQDCISLARLHFVAGVAWGPQALLIGGKRREEPRSPARRAPRRAAASRQQGLTTLGKIAYNI